MRDDAGSDPSARDAARGVIGLSAFANNRKGDARSADTCAERRRSIRRRQSRDHTNETKKIFTQFPTASSIGESARRVAARATLKIRHPHRHRREQTNIEKRAGKRNASVCLLVVVARTSSVGRAGRSGVFASASSFVASVRSAVASASAVAARRVARRRPDILARRTREPSFRAVRPPARPSFPECPSVFRLSERRREKEKRISDVRHVVVVTQFHPSRLFFVLFQSLDRTTERPNDRTTRVDTARSTDGWMRAMDGWMRSTERDRSNERCVATERCDAIDAVERSTAEGRARDGRPPARGAPTGGFYFYDGRTDGRTDGQPASGLKMSSSRIDRNRSRGLRFILDLCMVCMHAPRATDEMLSTLKNPKP